MIVKFDVFGTYMSVIRRENEWHLFVESDTSIRRRVYDIMIPSDLAEHELKTFLDDMYHERATEQHQQVRKLS